MRDWPKYTPWETEDDLKKALEETWEKIKGRGLKAGVLVRQADGKLMGKGDIQKLFDLED